MQLREYIRQTVEEVAAAFDGNPTFRAEIQFDVDVSSRQTLDGKTNDIECESRGVRVTVLIGRDTNDT